MLIEGRISLRRVSPVLKMVDHESFGSMSRGNNELGLEDLLLEVKSKEPRSQMPLQLLVDGPSSLIATSSLDPCFSPMRKR